MNGICDMWMPIKAPDGWNGEHDEFKCGVCMVKEMILILILIQYSAGRF